MLANGIALFSDDCFSIKRGIYLTQVGEGVRWRARTCLSTRVAPSDATDAAAAA